MMVGLIKNFEVDCPNCEMDRTPDCPHVITCKERIVWVAMDADGVWWGYRVKPTRNGECDMWICQDGTPIPIRVEIDWRATLQRVRQGTARKPK